MRTTGGRRKPFIAVIALLAAALPGAAAAAEMCPMGGAMILAGTDYDGASAWAAKGPGPTAVTGAAAGDWSVLAFSDGDRGVALFLAPGQVFFGVSGRGGETYPRDIDQAFGADRAKLRAAIRATLPGLVAAGAVRIDAADVPAVADAAGLGVLEKGPAGWALTTRDCQAVDLPTSGL